MERRSKRNVWWYKAWQRPTHASVIFIGQTLSTKSRVMRGSPCHGTVIVVNRISIILVVASERQRTFSYWRAARARHRRNFGDASWGDRCNAANFSAPSMRRPQGGWRAGADTDGVRAPEPILIDWRKSRTAHPHFADATADSYAATPLTTAQAQLSRRPPTPSA